MKPWTRWWWEGSAVNKQEITRNLEQYQKAGGKKREYEEWIV
jgi:hypothetical protein